MVCVGGTGKQHGMGKCGMGMPMLPPCPSYICCSAGLGWCHLGRRKEECALAPVSEGYVDLSLLLCILPGMWQRINRNYIQIDLSAGSEFLERSWVAVDVLLCTPWVRVKVCVKTKAAMLSPSP